MEHALVMLRVKTSAETIDSWDLGRYSTVTYTYTYVRTHVRTCMYVYSTVAHVGETLVKSSYSTNIRMYVRTYLLYMVPTTYTRRTHTDVCTYVRMKMCTNNMR